MINRIALTASALAVLAAAANAQVFLSFADNGTLTSVRTNTTASTSTFSGTGTNYTQAPAGAGITAPAPVDAVLSNLTFTITEVNGFGAGSGDPQEFNLTDGGTITVSDAGLGTLFVVSFDTASLDQNGFSASDGNGDNVVYSSINPILAPYISNVDDAFGFAFPNNVIAGNTVSYQTQAQFSSAPVPEPTTMVALGLGAVAMLRRRRKA